MLHHDQRNDVGLDSPLKTNTSGAGIAGTETRTGKELALSEWQRLKGWLVQVEDLVLLELEGRVIHRKSTDHLEISRMCWRVRIQFAKRFSEGVIKKFLEVISNDNVDCFQRGKDIRVWVVGDGGKYRLSMTFFKWIPTSIFNCLFKSKSPFFSASTTKVKR